MDPEYLNRDDVISISPQSVIIDLTNSDDDTDLPVEMDPEYLNSDDVIPISPQRHLIDISDSDSDTDLPDSETVKSQRQLLINKIFSSQSSQPSSSSSEPTAVNLKEKTQNSREYIISKVKVVFPVIPYGCQLNVASKVITALNDKVNCLVESPTGTGKTFALLCASLAWQLKEKENIGKSVDEQYPKLDPEKQKCSPNKTNTTKPTPPRYIKQNFGEKSIYDNHTEDKEKTFLNVIQNQPGPSTATVDNYYSTDDNLVKIHKKPRIDNSYVGQTSSQYPTAHIQKEVREPTTPEKNRQTSLALEEALSNMKKISYLARLPVIFYGARTHKQLEQVIQEFGKTIYCDQANMTILSSRENSCIRDYDSRKWSSKKEMCKNCIKPALSKNSNNTFCEYYNNRSNLNRNELPSAFDLNVLKEKGRELGSCPYYAARNMMADAYIVFCPYNFLIDPLIRKSMRINFKDDIIIIDEGHNIEDICRQTATFSFTIDQVEAAHTELNNAMWAGVETFIDHLIKVLNNWVRWFKNCSRLLEAKPLNDNNVAIYDWDVNNFIKTLEEHSIVKSQYPDFNKNVTLLCEKVGNNPNSFKQITTSTVTFLESFNHILGYIFGEYLDSYKPQLEMKFKETKDRTIAAFENRSNRQHYKLHLYCLNPAVVFSQLSAARTVILASGTLAPLDSLKSELDTEFKYKVTDEHSKLEKRVWVGKLGLREDGRDLFCLSRDLGDRDTQCEVGRVLSRVCDVTPHGVLCFLPSYAALRMLYDEWDRSGILSTIKKKVFQESNDIADHEAVMKKYTEAAKVAPGALLLAVYRGKAAEGMDFRDEQARAVVLVGIPYPNCKDEAIRIKMDYNDALKKKHQNSDKKWLSGKQWLDVQAFRALNQAMGRCVRHKRDWGAVLLVDARYGHRQYMQHVSAWARHLVCDTVFDYNSLINHQRGIKAFMTQNEAKDKNGEIQEN